jgi:hypothetical protein
MKGRFFGSLLFLLLLEGALLVKVSTPIRSQAIVQPANAIEREPRLRKGNPSQGSASAKAKGGPTNAYKHFTSLEELVDNRPYNFRKKATRDYHEAFQTHPEVASIKVDPRDKVKLAKDTLQLRYHSNSTPWQMKMTMTLRDYFEHANIDTKTQDYILGYHKDNRKRRADVQRYEESVLKDPEGTSRKAKWRQDCQDRRVKLNSTRRTQRAFAKKLEQLIQGRRLSTLEVEKAAESLYTSFPDQAVFDSALLSYLKKKKFPAEEIAMIRGSRYMNREKERLAKVKERKTAERRRAAVASASPSTSTSDQDSSAVGHRPDDHTSSTSANPATSIQTHKNGPTGQISSAENSRIDKSVDELECGPWWERGCFDD